MGSFKNRGFYIDYVEPFNSEVNQVNQKANLPFLYAHFILSNLRFIRRFIKKKLPPRVSFLIHLIHVLSLKFQCCSHVTTVIHLYKICRYSRHRRLLRTVITTIGLPSLINNNMFTSLCHCSITNDGMAGLEAIIGTAELAIKCRCDSRELGSPETPPRGGTVLGNTVRGGGE